MGMQADPEAVAKAMGAVVAQPGVIAQGPPPGSKMSKMAKSLINPDGSRRRSAGIVI